jgi:hypothetical protein
MWASGLCNGLMCKGLGGIGGGNNQASLIWYGTQ